MNNNKKNLYSFGAYTKVEQCLSVRLKLKILVTPELNRLYSSGNIPTGPVVVLSYFLWGWDIPLPPPPKKKKKKKKNTFKKFVFL